MAVRGVANAQRTYVLVQVLVVPLLLLVWAVLASRTPAFTWIIGPISDCGLFIAELALLIACLATLMCTQMHVVLGPRIKQFSTFASTFGILSQDIWIGAPV